jgi:TP901 family phage tail tape measure protein
MADNVEKLGLDASGFINGVQQVVSAVGTLNSSIKLVTDVMLEFNVKNAALNASLNALNPALKNLQSTASNVAASSNTMTTALNANTGAASKLTSTLGTLNTTAAGTAAAMSSSVSATNQAAGGLNNLTSAVKKTDQATSVFIRGFSLSFGNIVRILEVTTIRRFFLTILEGMTSSVTKSAEFQQSMSQIAVFANNAGGGIDGLTKQILALSSEFNKPSADVAAAALRGYTEQVIKAASDTNVLDEAVRLSRITFTTAESAMEALTSVLKAYGLSNVDAARTTDQLNRLFQTTGINAAQQGSAFQSLNATAAQLGIPFAQVAAALQSMRDKGIPAGEAVTQLNRVLTQLLNPTPILRQALAGIGASSGQSAIEVNGLAGALRRLHEQAIDQNTRDVLFGPRNSRSEQALTDTAAIQRNQAGFENNEDNARRARDAATTLGQSFGDQFKRELEKVQNFLVGEVGPKFIEALVKIGEPFGGLSNLIKKVVSAAQDLATVILDFGRIVASVLAFFDKWGVSIATIVEGLILLKVSTIAINAVSQAFAATQAAIVATSGGLTNAFTGMSGTMGQAATAIAVTRTQTATLTVAMNGLKAAAIAIAPVLAAIAVVALVQYFAGVNDTAKQLAETLDSLDAKAKKATEVLTANLGQITQESESLAAGMRTRMAELFAPLTANIEASVNTQRTAVERLKEAFASASSVVVSNLQHVFSQLESKIKQTQSNIETSFKQILSFSDKTEKELFQKQLHTAGEVQQLSQFKSGDDAINARRLLAAQEIATRNQEAMIQGRINQLLREANELGAKGDKDSLEAMRRKLEEARALTNQGFDLQSTQNRRTADFRAQLTGRDQQFNPLDAERGQALRGLDAQQTALERRAQEMNARTQAALQSVADLERGRLREISRTFSEIQNFRLTDSQGRLRQEFTGNNGAQNFERELGGLITASQSALNRPLINPQMMDRLTRQVGQDLAAQTQRQVQEGNLTQEQASRLQQQGVTPDMISALQQAAQNFRANDENLARLNQAINDLRTGFREQIGREREREALLQAQERIRATIQEGVNLQREMVRLLQEANNNLTTQFRSATQGIDVGRSNVSDLTPLIAGIETGIANQRVSLSATQAQQAVNRANENRTPENVAAAGTALEAFINQLRSFITARGVGPQDPARQRLENTISELTVTLNNIRQSGQRAVDATTGVGAARQTQLEAAAAVEFALGGSNRPTTAAGAIDPARLLQDLLGPGNSRMADLAGQIGRLADAVSRLPGAGNQLHPDIANIIPPLPGENATPGGPQGFQNFLPSALLEAMGLTEGATGTGAPSQRTAAHQQQVQQQLQQIATNSGLGTGGNISSITGNPLRPQASPGQVPTTGFGPQISSTIGGQPNNPLARRDVIGTGSGSFGAGGRESSLPGNGDIFGTAANVNNLRQVNTETVQQMIQRGQITDPGQIADLARRYGLNPDDLTPAVPYTPLVAGPNGVYTLPGQSSGASEEEEGYAEGGLIGNAFSAMGKDNVRINARIGEFVVNPDSTRQFYTQLVAMNRGDLPRGNGYAQGGTVTNSIGSMDIHVNGAENPEKTARAVFNRIRREQRRGNI